MDITDFQDTTFDGTAFITTNLPAHSTGVELEASWNSPAGLEARLAVTWADATEEIHGESKQLTQAPRLSGIASLAYSRNLGASLRGSVGFDCCIADECSAARRALSLELLRTAGSATRTRRDVRRWGVALIGRNVTNRVSADFAGPTPDPTQPSSAMPAALRSVLLSGGSVAERETRCVSPRAKSSEPHDSLMICRVVGR
jgi:hypothetical protein